MLRIAFPLIFAGALALGGCAAIEKSEARSAEDLLSASGFKQIAADTPARANALKTMKPRTISIVTKNGTKYWVYPDPTNCGCLFAGTEAQYQEYKRLVVQQNIADEEAMAAEESDMDFGAWGGEGIWR